jgi:hypothetical protein
VLGVSEACLPVGKVPADMVRQEVILVSSYHRFAFHVA